VLHSARQRLNKEPLSLKKKISIANWSAARTGARKGSFVPVRHGAPIRNRDLFFERQRLVI
jgi:hypothetical protein